jgi:hypothetical protein
MGNMVQVSVVVGFVLLLEGPNSFYLKIDDCCYLFSNAIVSIFLSFAHYSMSLIYTIAGLVTGEKGRDFLHCADSYLGHVKVRTEAPADDEQPSKDWCRLQIAVLNNQVCISNELCMHNEAKGHLFEMRQRISSAYHVMDMNILEEFALNLQCLLRTGDLASAA